MSSTRFERILNELRAIPAELQAKSGALLYSGTHAFSQDSRLYILGLNPGGSPQNQAKETISNELAGLPSWPEYYSRYLDDAWQGKAPGTHGMQPRVRHMFHRLGIDLRSTPASNLVFVRSQREADLAEEKAHLMEACWPAHRTIIRELRVDTILCFGTTTGRWVREALNAHTHFGSYKETNSRGWSSHAHSSSDDKIVITVSHPSIANWTNPQADPTELVLSALNRSPPQFTSIA